jgi:hypothetical protein
MIRRFDNFYRRRPRAALGIMLVIFALTLYAADRADRANSMVWAATTRGAT